MSEPVLGDLDHDYEVDIFDWVIFQPNFGVITEEAAYEDGDLTATAT